MFRNAKKNGESVIFDIINLVFMILFCASTIYPFLYVLSLSLAPNSVAFTGLYIPTQGIELAHYRYLLSTHFFTGGFINTVVRTAIGTFITVIATVLTAYPLSKPSFPHRSFWTAIIVFTMFFSGGLVPSYILINQLGLMNTVWALTLPSLVNTFHMIIVRNYFMSLPDSLEEAAHIDGANDIRILFSIILPISAPIIATVVLWTAVYHWNAWFDSMIYIQDAKKQVLQVALRRLVIENLSSDLLSEFADAFSTNMESLKSAAIMVTALPIIMLYPFLQKYFVKGIIVGSLKG